MEGRKQKNEEGRLSVCPPQNPLALKEDRERPEHKLGNRMRRLRESHPVGVFTEGTCHTAGRISFGKEFRKGAFSIQKIGTARERRSEDWCHVNADGGSLPRISRVSRLTG
jgi:hypothetical protein